MRWYFPGGIDGQAAPEEVKGIERLQERSRVVSASRVDEGYLESTGDLGRARECATGTRTQSYGAVVMWNVLCLHMARRFCDWPRLPTETGLDEAHVYPTGSSQFVWTVVIFPRLTSLPGWAVRLNLTQTQPAVNRE